MLNVLISYIVFHYGRAYVEGYKALRGHGLALGFIGVPLAILWTFLPLVLVSFFLSGLYFIFLWNVL